MDIELWMHELTKRKNGRWQMMNAISIWLEMQANAWNENKAIYKVQTWMIMTDRPLKQMAFYAKWMQ